MGLRGPFPIGLKNCTSLIGLDLSGNYLTGHIPSSVADVIPFVTTLDLSNNNLSGPIPSSISNLSYINILRLNNNQLTGQIPLELSNLNRIKEFTVANNRLSGQVPNFPNDLISEESYAHNLGLCGAPLSPCDNENHDDDDDDLFFSGFAVGFPVSTTLTVLLLMFCCFPMRNVISCVIIIKNITARKHRLIPQISQTVSAQEIKITTLERYVRPLNLAELKRATNDLDIKNVIGYGNMGVMYKAVFPNGLMLAIKRLHNYQSFEKEFLLEIDILGTLRHINLVPLLFFCCEMRKKFLIYKYMSNGTLHQWLHSRPQVEGRKMGWSLRLRIAVGIARGLAWLHHNNVLRVAHLKISSNCILLDDKFEPKISNFGNSKILMNTSCVVSSGCTSVVPHSSLERPYKEDVYGFGILLLELVSGRESPLAQTDTDSLRDNICGEEFNMIDECLTGGGFNEEIYETLRIAENCIQTHKDGATSMLQVYHAIRAVGISRNEISIDPYMDLEGNEGDV